MDVLQVTATLRATIQRRLLRPIHLPRLLPPMEHAYPSFTTWFLAHFHPLPPGKWRRLAQTFPFQLFVLFSLLLQQALQPQDLHPLALVAGTFPHQLQLQFGDAIIRSVGCRGNFLLVGSAHARQSTAFFFQPTESFDLFSPAI